MLQMLRLEIAAALLLIASPVMAEPITGRASVIDGDTIEIAGKRIRFDGIDAPESRQSCEDTKGEPYRCGAMAANALADWLAQSSPTTCEATGKDRYGRAIAKCARADCEDLARAEPPSPRLAALQQWCMWQSPR